MAESTDNKTIEDLLPYYVNGTLSDEETALIEKELADNQGLQQEIEFLQALRAQVKQQEFNTSPGELGLKRLQRSIAAEAKASSTHTASNTIWRMATVAACLMLVIQTVIVNFDTETPYLAAGGKTPTSPQGQIISVTFTPDVTEQAIRQLLLDTNAQIVDGPSAIGIYRLVVPEGHTNVINIFNTRPDVIESVQKEP